MALNIARSHYIHSGERSEVRRSQHIKSKWMSKSTLVTDTAAEFTQLWSNFPLTLILTIADYLWLFLTFSSQLLTLRWLYITLNSCCNISNDSSWLCNDKRHKQIVLSKIWLHMTKCLIREGMTMMWHTMTYFDPKMDAWQFLTKWWL